MAYSVLFGAALSLMSRGLSVVGQTLQRKSKIEQDGEKSAKPPWRRTRWLIGTFLYVVAALFDALSFTFAPKSVIIVIYGLRLPIIVALAWAMLGARVTRTQVGGVLACAAGAAVSLIYAPKTAAKPLQNPAEFFSPSLVAYLAVSAVACGILAACVFCQRRAARGSLGSCGAFAMPLLAAWVVSVEKLFNTGMGQVPKGSSLMEVRWVWLPMTYLCFGVASLVLNVYAMEVQSTHVFVPACFGFLAALMGVQGALFGEFNNTSQAEATVWAIGMLCAVGGTYLTGEAKKEKGPKDGKSQEQISAVERLTEQRQRDAAKDLPLTGKMKLEAMSKARRMPGKFTPQDEASDIYLECHLGDNEPMLTRVRNIAGSERIQKESFQINIDEASPTGLMTLLVKDGKAA